MIMQPLTIPWETEKKLTLELMWYHTGTESRLETSVKYYILSFDNGEST